MTVAGEEEFVAFYEAQWPRLLAALAWSVPDGEDPQDVAQEAFARAFEHWSTLRDHSRPDAWLFLTGYRLATSLRRRARRRSQADQTPILQPEDSFQGVLIEDLLATIPPRQRAALLMRHFYGLSTRQAAQAMRCREGTVKSLLARGRERLRLSLSEGELDR